MAYVKTNLASQILLFKYFQLLSINGNEGLYIWEGGWGEQNNSKNCSAQSEMRGPQMVFQTFRLRC